MDTEIQPIEVSTIVVVALIQTPIVVVLTLLLNKLVNQWEARRQQKLIASVIRKWGKNVEGLGFDFLLRDVGWKSGNVDLLFKGLVLNALGCIEKDIGKATGKPGTPLLGLSTERDAETFGKKYYGEKLQE